MAYSIHSHISYILEADSKRLVREKKMRNISYIEEIEWSDIFSFLIKIFHNTLFSSLCFQTNNNKKLVTT